MKLATKTTLSWDREKVFVRSDDFFEELLRQIESARSEILFETYIFDPDALGDRIVQALCQAARRGVRVKLLVDGIGSPLVESIYREELEASGVSLNIYHRVGLKRFRDIFYFVNPRRFIEAIQRLNKRNHRKVVLIDGKTAFVGSQNITQVHLHSIFGDKAWRDTGICVEGPPVRLLAEAFYQVWFERTWIPRLRRKLWRLFEGELIRLNATRKLRKKNFNDLIQKIYRSKTRIWITTPYFVPNRKLLKALQSAGRRVDVQLLVPARPDVGFIRWIAASAYFRLMTHGVRVFEYQPSVLHAKSLLIDQWSMVGSSNLNHRSLLHDLEVDIVVTQDESRRVLEQTFHEDLEKSREVTITALSQRPVYEAIFGYFLHFVRYWL